MLDTTGTPGFFSGKLVYDSKLVRGKEICVSDTLFQWAKQLTNLGSIRGFATTVMVAFSAMGALPFGLIYDRTGSYDDAIFILLILPVIAGIAYMLAKEPKLKSKLNVF